MTDPTPTLIAIRERAQPLIAYYSTLPPDEAIRDLCERFAAGELVDDWRAGRVTELTRERDAAEARLSAIRSWIATYPAVPGDHDGPLDGEMLFVQRLREALGPDAPVEPTADLRPILAAIDNALRNGSHMTGANYAFLLLCDRLGVDRDALEFRPNWKRPDGGKPQ